jgi:tripartite-type tricarboxylate transporter receptor subunit TctC
MVFRLTYVSAFVAAATGLSLVSPQTAAAADKYPCDVQVVIHAKYGGGTDTTARMMMIRSRRLLGVEMNVVAKRGGSGAAAQNYVLSQPADGCTLIALTQSHLYTLARNKSKMKIGDLIGVARAMDDPTFVTVRKESPYKTLKDLVDASKKEALNWGVAEIGNTEHIGIAQLAKATGGFKYKPVALGSGLQMVQNLMSGAIDVTTPNVSEGKEQVSDGTFRALAVMSKKRLKDFPDVPTTYELGYKVATTTTRGYAVRAGTPPERVKALSDALTKAMKHSTFATYLKGSGLNPDDSVAASAEWTEQLQEEYQKAVSALTELGIAKKK